jgi:hypothetical protein
MDDAQPPEEIGTFTGLPLDLPPGRHPFDWYIYMLEATLGHRKTARYLGFFVIDEES